MLITAAIAAGLTGVVTVRGSVPPQLDALAAQDPLGGERLARTLEALAALLPGRSFMAYGGFGGGVVTLGPGPQVVRLDQDTRSTEWTGRPAVACDGRSLEGELALEWESGRRGWRAEASAWSRPHPFDPVLDLWRVPVGQVADAGFRDLEGLRVRGLEYPHDPPPGTRYEATRQSLWFDVHSGLPVRWELHVTGPETVSYGYYFVHAPAWDRGPGPELERPDCVDTRTIGASAESIHEGGGAMARLRAAGREVVELHDFFESWFRGDLPDADESFARVADVLAPEFALVAPDGSTTGRVELLARLREAHGARPGLHIRVDGVTLLLDEETVLVADYEEIQQEPGATPTRRRSTAVFRLRPDAPNELEWVRVHETWVQEPDGDATRRGPQYRRRE